MTKELIILLGRDPKKTCPFCNHVDIDGPFCNYEGTSEITMTSYCLNFKKQTIVDRIKRRYFIWRMNCEDKNRLCHK